MIDGKNSKTGYFVGATIIDNVDLSMQSYQNEIFGPVLQIIEINDMQEAIKIINDNNFEMGAVYLQVMDKKLEAFQRKWT